MSKRTVCSALLAGLVPTVVWAQFPLGPEFQVNTYTFQRQGHPAVASEPAGRFVVVWDGPGPHGTYYNVFGQRYDEGGAPEPGEFRVNAYTTVSNERPAVTFHANGFVVAYQRSHDDGFGHGVFARRFGTSGAALGGEFRVHSHTTGYQGQPAVASDIDGNFVVVWKSQNQDGSGDGLFGQRYDAAGGRLGGEFAVNSHTPGAQALPAVASDPDGDIVVVWQSDGQDGSSAGVYARRDVGGMGLGDEFRVNPYTTGSQGRPAVASTPDGGFIVVWDGQGSDGIAIFGRRYDASGAAVGGEFRVNSHTTGTKREPAVAADAGGNFVVVWHGDGEGDSSFGVFGQLYDASGERAGGEFRLNTYTTGFQQQSAVAFDADGNFVVTWQSDGQDGSSTAVIARRFSPDIFEDGFESADLSAWSTSVTGSGNLRVHINAAMKSTGFGLEGVVESTAPLYVQDDSPHEERRYRARFYFDPNGFDPGEALNHRRVRLFIVFEENPTRRLAAIVLRRLSGAYGLMGRARLDDNSQHDTGFFAISDGPHFVELDWKRASGPDANDGSFELWIDGTSVYANASLDNGLSSVDFVRLGALTVKAGASGTLYWDEFVSRRLSSIGP